MTGERSLPAPLPPHCGARAAGAGAAEAPTLPPAVPHNRSRGRALCAPILQVGKLRTEEGKDWLKVTRLDCGRRGPAHAPREEGQLLGQVGDTP